MSNLKLYEYTENYENLLELIEENPELDAEAIADALDGIQESAEEKIFNTAGFIKKLEDDVELIKNRVRELNETKAQKAKKVEDIKNYLLEHMIRMDIKKMDNGTRLVRYQNNPKSIDVINTDKVPKDFKKYKTTLNVDAKSLPKKWASKLVDSQEVVDKKALLSEYKDKEEKEYGSFARINQSKSVRIK